MLTLVFSAVSLIFAIFLLLTKWTFFKLEAIRPRSIYLAFILKFISGCVLVWIYTYVHTDRSTADIYKFMDDAAVLHEIRVEHPQVFWQLLTGVYQDESQFETYLYKTGNWNTQDINWLNYAQIKDYNPFNSNRFITRVNALLWFVTQGNIYLHVLVFSFFGFCGLIAYYKLIAQRLNHQQSKQLLFLVLFLLPGLLLWCSAPLKDTLVILFTGVFFRTWFQSKSSAWMRVPSLLVLFALILLLKYYIAAAILLFSGMYLILQISKLKQMNFGLLLILIIGLGIGINQIAYQFGFMPDVFSFLAEKRIESLKNAAFADARSYLFQLPAAGFLGMLTAMLSAPVNALFLPLYPANSFSPLMLIQILENWVILIVIIWLIIHRNKSTVSTAIFRSWLIYVFALALIIGFTSPLAGNLLRYKTAFMPVLIGLIFIGTHEQKLIDLKIYRFLAKL
ncbi:MAG: hypothetical protein ACK4GL_08170 [Flavobacteriales bacterium]